ncbi:MAG: UDP-glucose 4-epimerase GalE [Phycisphaeraceae bacterium]|nr:UDP-glucose 4-epimerase GalE [Phycisphaeraceae bacterium]
MNILVTGGAGYIGSHAVQRLVRDGHRVVALDNLFRGHREAINLIASGAGGRLTFVQGDVGDRGLVDRVLREHGIETVMHFAALAYVGESVNEPLRYYRNNAAASLVLLEACAGAGVGRVVFSSTCATYGEPAADRIPIAETCPQSPINPYGWSKLHVEHMLRDVHAQARRQGRAFAYAALRYFNVAGSDRTGLIGEHHEPETHLIPVVLQVALGQREKVTIFGTDYPTPDGTCIRDYVHVEDLVDAHVAVMGSLDPAKDESGRVYNLGIGRGYSVREIIGACERVTGKRIAVVEGDRRAGDPPALYADPRKIQRDLSWRASITDLDEIVGSAWRWFEKHPRGYGRE